LRFKNDDTDGKVKAFAFASESLDDRPMAQVDAIKIANGGYAALAWEVL
jgi:hypothetical protein